jgi:hypothetical protein
MNGGLLAPEGALPALPCGGLVVPPLVADQGERAAKRCLEFFADHGDDPRLGSDAE